MRAKDPVLASSSRPRARYLKPSAPAASRATPSPTHASSAIACKVSSASHSRQSRASVRSSSGIPARARTTPHSRARRPGIAPFRSSAQASHRRAASVTASGQSGKSAGGQLESAGGERAKRYASERWRITSVSASTSGGHSSSSSPIMVPATSCHTDPGVGAVGPSQPGSARVTTVVVADASAAGMTAPYAGAGRSVRAAGMPRGRRPKPSGALRRLVRGRAQRPEREPGRPVRRPPP
jgi:hypothetical protein